jgi:dipeptidyl aminopeptidase/acylaminoacyl peptidase
MSQNLHALRKAQGRDLRDPANEPDTQVRPIGSLRTRYLCPRQGSARRTSGHRHVHRGRRTAGYQQHTHTHLDGWRSSASVGTSAREGRQNIFWQLADGSGGLEQLTSGEHEQYPNSFSPDGQLLAFYEIHPSTGRDIWVLRLSDRKAEPFLATPASEASPKFSPDGRWLAYSSNESGRPEIYVRPYPGPGARWPVSVEGAPSPSGIRMVASSSIAA